MLPNHELTTLIERIDWSKTTIGATGEWPQSLKTSLGIVMNLKQPAFLWWGAEQIQFFNETYKQCFVDQGDHPAEIGKAARLSWGQSWSQMLPLVNNILSGSGATWTEDDLGGERKRSLHVAGQWTYGATPIIGESGSVNGIMVLCIPTVETPTQYGRGEFTNKLTLLKTREEEKIATTPEKKLPDLFSIIDSSPEFISMMDTGGRVQYLNPIALRTLGWDSFDGKSIWDAIHPEDVLLARKIIDETIANGFASNEVRFRNARTGTLFWLKLNLVVSRDVLTGEVTGLSSVSQNITEFRKMQRALIEGEARFRNIVAQSPIPIALTRGKDVVIESINEPMLYFMGKGGQNVIGKKMIEVLPELVDQPVLQIVKNILDTGEVFKGLEVPIQLVMDGELQQFYFNLTYSPLIENGTITGVLHSASDVTHQVLARKKIEESEAELQQHVEERTRELQAVNVELQRSNRQLEEFAYAASHDLKEPVRKIRIFANRLKTQLQSKLETKDVEMFERVEQASKRMGQLIDDLLMYSHVSMVPHGTEPVDLNAEITLALDDLELKITEKNAVINVNKLPVVHGFKRQLQQLFQNLVSNAIKYNRAGIAPEVLITSGIVHGKDIGMPYDKDYYQVTVSDNGIGFDSTHAEQIFQMFQRLHNNREYEGTGVGLAIARKIVENHHGKIFAESEPGNGATFHVFLPVSID